MVMTVIPVEQNDIIVNDCQRWAKQGFPYGDGSFTGQGFKRNDKSTGVETMMGSSRTYLPAAGHDWSLPLYDPIVKLLGGDAARKALIKQLYPDVEVVGLDPDPKALARARRKAARAGVSIQFDQGFGDELPYPEAWFDCVFSSFMFHHLPPDEKGKTLRAIRRVVKPGGEFYMLDLEGREDGAHGFLAHLLHSSDRMKDNSGSRVLSLMSQAGLAAPKKVAGRRLLFGGVAYYRAGAE